MRSVKAKILFWVLILVIGSVAVLGIFSAYQSQNAIMKLNKESQGQIAESYANNLGDIIDSVEGQIRVLSQRKSLESLDWDKSKIALMDMINFSKGEILTTFLGDTSGKVHFITTGKEGVADISDRKYFNEIVNDNKDLAVSEPVISKATGQHTFVVATAIKDDSGNLKGILGATINMAKIKNLVSKLKIGAEGHGFVISSTGLFIVHPDKEVEFKLNINSLSDNAYKVFANDIKSGKQNGDITAMAPDGDGLVLFEYYRIPNSPNWYFGTVVPISQLRAYSNQIIVFTLIIGVIIVVIAIIIAFMFGNSISKPIKNVSLLAEKFGEGDLTVQTSDIKGKDEIARMASILNESIRSLKENVSEIIKVGEQLNASSGELKQRVDRTLSINEKIYANMDKVTQDGQNTSAAIEEINASTEEVASSAQNVANIAQDLAEKANESFETSKESIELVKGIIENVVRTSDGAKDTEKVVQDLVQNTKNIGSIVDTVTSISEQTALLALNAAIEAARAGEAGKGFAVIADEIRALADESKKSTEKITTILNSISELAEKTGKGSLETLDNIQKISESAEKTSGNLDTVLHQFESITSMTENLASTAEEQSAAAEEIASATTNAAQTVDDIARSLEELFSVVKDQKEDLDKIGQTSETLAQLAQTLHKNSEGFKTE